MNSKASIVDKVQGVRMWITPGTDQNSPKHRRIYKGPFLGMACEQMPDAKRAHRQRSRWFRTVAAALFPPGRIVAMIDLSRLGARPARQLG
jgi:hypothetical protein